MLDIDRWIDLDRQTDGYNYIWSRACIGSAMKTEHATGDIYI